MLHGRYGIDCVIGYSFETAADKFQVGPAAM